MENLLSIFNKPELAETTPLHLLTVKHSTGEEMTLFKRELPSEDLTMDGLAPIILIGL
jgi:hypothetical protein